MAKRPRVPLTLTRLANIAFLAGQGYSASEIAAAMGMKPGHVYWLLFAHHIQLAPKTAADAVIPPLMVSKQTMSGVESLAKELSLPPTWMLGRLLEAVLAEPNIALNLLDGVKAPSKKKAA
ncbi:hypothetical protein [Methylocystis echinoides]|uniref:hypothetical protein n=1 Tax=Methylocystis echinoides TaxID=29468 RepID=UPI00342C1A89